MEWIYLHDARNAEMAPIQAKTPIITHEYSANICVNPERKPLKSTKAGCGFKIERIQSADPTASNEAIVAYIKPWSTKGP